MPESSRKSFPNVLKGIFTDDRIVMVIIFLNASLFVALDIDPELFEEIGGWVGWIDFACVIFFIIEALIKISEDSFRGYFFKKDAQGNNNHWNKLDFFIVIASLPVVIEPFIEDIGSEYGWVGVIRVARIFKMTRVLRSLRLLQYTRNNSSKFLVGIKHPVYTLLIASGSNLFIGFMDISVDWTAEYYRYYPSVIIIIVTWLISRLYAVFHRVRVDLDEKDQANNITRRLLPKSLESIISSLVQFVIWTIGLLLAFDKAGYNTTTILAGVGLGGMAVALAAQDFIGNLIGGILLYFKNSFQIGHTIKIGGFEGEVVQLGLSDIRIRDVSGRITSLPNKMFISEPIENYTEAELASDIICLRIDKNLSSEKLKKATEIILEEARSNKYIKDDYSIRFGPMSSNVHELYFEYYLDKKTLEDDKPHENDPLQELINGQNTAIYIKLVQALQSEEINFG